jgi:hypothetical protein
MESGCWSSDASRRRFLFPRTSPNLEQHHKLLGCAVSRVDCAGLQPPHLVYDHFIHRSPCDHRLPPQSRRCSGRRPRVKTVVMMAKRLQSTASSDRCASRRNMLLSSSGMALRMKPYRQSCSLSSLKGASLSELAAI